MANNYNSSLQTINIGLQEILDTIKDLPEANNGVELPELTNEGTASDLLSGKQLIDGEGNIVEGNIPTKTLYDISVSGASVSIPSGYYSTDMSKSVSTATRAETTISVSADDTNDKLTITASNNQGTGYVTGSNKTASKTISLTASGATVTASDGINSISKSVATVTQATPSITVDTNGLITASATQTAGYVSAGTKSGTKQLTTQAAKTITPTTSEQTAVAKDTYTTGVVKIAAIPSNYEDVGSETTSYTSLLGELETAINNLPDASGTGEGSGESNSSIDTCTIALNIQEGTYGWGLPSEIAVSNWGSILYQAYENGIKRYKKIIIPPEETLLTISNVVCNSLIVLGLEDSWMITPEIKNISGTMQALDYDFLETDGALYFSLPYGGAFITPTVKDEYCTGTLECNVS